MIDYEFAGYNHEGFDFSSYIMGSLFNFNFPTFPFYDYSPEGLISDSDLIFMIQ